MATYINIATTTLSSNTSNIYFTSVPQIYSDLVIKLYARDTQGAYRSQMFLYVNEDRTDYAEIGTYIAGGAKGAFLGDSTTEWYKNNYIPGALTGALGFGVAEFYLPKYATSNKKIMMGYSSATAMVMSDSTVRTGVIAGIWNDASAITSIRLFANTAFVAGTVASLYGIE